MAVTDTVNRSEFLCTYYVRYMIHTPFRFLPQFVRLFLDFFPPSVHLSLKGVFQPRRTGRPDTYNHLCSRRRGLNG